MTLLCPIQAALIPIRNLTERGVWCLERERGVRGTKDYLLTLWTEQLMVAASAGGGAADGQT